MAPRIGGVDGVLAIRTNGSYFATITAADTSGWGILTQGSWEGSIDNISVKEMEPAP